MNAGPWRAARTDDGSWTLVHPGLGEACHSLAGAWTQARERYASALDDLPPEVQARGRVRLLDIGTGLGQNLAAALERCEALGLVLDAVTLEADLDVPRAALELARIHGACSPEHRRILAALEARLALAPAGVRTLRELAGTGAHLLELVAGDARETLPRLEEARRFDLVFLDPFSPRVDPPLWEDPFLAEVARRMAPGARLATYTIALRVRAALARAGLEVGAGPRVGRKAEGTLASRGGAVPPLDERTRKRLARVLAGGRAEEPPPGQK